MNPDLLAQNGRTAYKSENYLGAARFFEAAAQMYQARGEILPCAEMLNNSSVAFLRAGEAEAALRCVKGTDEVFANAGDLRRQGMALGNLGAALESLRKTDEAIDAYESSSVILKQAGESELYAHVMQSLSGLHLRSKHQLEAVATMQAGLEGLQRPSLRQRIIRKLLQAPFIK